MCPGDLGQGLAGLESAAQLTGWQAEDPGGQMQRPGVDSVPALFPQGVAERVLRVDQPAELLLALFDYLSRARFVDVAGGHRLVEALSQRLQQCRHQLICAGSGGLGDLRQGGAGLQLRRQFCGLHFEDLGDASRGSMQARPEAFVLLLPPEAAHERGQFLRHRGRLRLIDRALLHQRRQPVENHPLRRIRVVPALLGERQASGHQHRGHRRGGDQLGRHLGRSLIGSLASQCDGDMFEDC